MKSLNGHHRGPLFAIGGAEDKFHDRVILRRFLKLAGGNDARIAILPTASSVDDAGQRYKAIFLELGAAAGDVLYVGTREDANRDDWVSIIEQSTAIFMTGGNQVRVASLLGGTRVADALTRKSETGTPVAGTSAGASVMSTVMVAGGRSGTTPRRSLAHMSPGLGLIDSVIIDQHFQERDRIGRLVTMVSYNPRLLGLGIDEDTAALIMPDGTLEVVGQGSVLVVDGASMISNVYDGKARQALTVSNIIIHFVAHGRCFDLVDRSLIHR